MRIVYLHQYFNTPDMAGGTRSYEMARRLVDWGHDVHMITTWREPAERKGWFETDVAGIHVHWLPVPYSNHMNHGQRIRAFFRFAVSAARRAAALPVDVVFATSTPLTIALPGTYVAWRQKIPMVFEVRDLWPELPIAIGALKNPVARTLAKRLERFAYNNAARVIALSPGMAEGVARTGYPMSRIDVIPNSADLELFAPDTDAALRFRSTHPEVGKGPIVLYPGTLGKINGVAYFAKLAALAGKIRPDVRFVVIGDGIEREYVRTTAKDLGVLGTNFFMYPSMPKRALAGAFSAADVVISLAIDLPEVRANSANKFFDGLASGTSVAVNYGGWQADLVQATGTGLALAPDPESAVTSLMEFLEDPAQVASTGHRARLLAETRFSRDTLARGLEEVLLKAVAQSR